MHVFISEKPNRLLKTLVMMSSWQWPCLGPADCKHIWLLKSNRKVSGYLNNCEIFCVCSVGLWLKTKEKKDITQIYFVENHKTSQDTQSSKAWCHLQRSFFNWLHMLWQNWCWLVLKEKELNLPIYLANWFVGLPLAFKSKV